MKVDTGDLFGNPAFDGIHPTISPFDLLSGGVAKGGQIALSQIVPRLRDVKWIRNTPRSQLQKKFKHAEDFGIKRNQNNKNLAKFQKALEDHVKSPNTTVIRGTYNKKEKVIHYYNSKTRINVMQDSTGKLRSVWRLSKKQQFHLFKDKNIGGGKK